MKYNRSSEMKKNNLLTILCVQLFYNSITLCIQIEKINNINQILCTVVFNQRSKQPYSNVIFDLNVIASLVRLYC